MQLFSCTTNVGTRVSVVRPRVELSIWLRFVLGEVAYMFPPKLVRTSSVRIMRYPQGPANSAHRVKRNANVPQKKR